MKSIFNVRVYGILINDKNELLVTDEYRSGMAFSKFPGGGLEFGEGTIDCLKREFREELGMEVEVTRHFYTTDFFQVSAFNSRQQLISIYYLVKNTAPLTFGIKHKKFDFEKLVEGAQTFRWVAVNKLTPEEFMFPVDKIVAEMLKTAESKKDL